MLKRTDIVYIYDGSFEGFLSCVFECYNKKEMPIDISKEQMTLWEKKYIVTDKERADRVYVSIKNKMGDYAQFLMKRAFLTCMDNKELNMMLFLELGYDVGRKVVNMLANDRVDKILKAVERMKGEAHLFLGFIRFSVFDDAMIAIIEPENFVLPIISGHFCDRYNAYSFVIYDKTHGVALIHAKGRVEILEVEDFHMPELNEDEIMYQKLWKQFYKTIEIEGRHNEKCRRTMMPKRYWANMLEVSDELLAKKDNIIALN